MDIPLDNDKRTTTNGGLKQLREVWTKYFKSSAAAEDDVHTGKTSSLQCQEVGGRKGAKELVVIWAYSVALV